MQYVRLDGSGGPQTLVPDRRPAPVPRPGEVLIKVAAVGVNRADLLQRAGLYPAPAGAPDWPGLEVSGTVLAAPTDQRATAAEPDGSAATAWREGDPVVALLSGGGYAEQVVVPAAQVLPAPGPDLVDAAALPEAACTVWSTVVDAAGLRAGEWLLVHGGSGGIGTLATQVAAALGARVIATAGGPDRAERCRALGAIGVVDHRAEDFVARVAEITDGHGADVVLDVVGAAYLARNVTALATGGRLAVIGLQQGRRAELDLATLLTRRATVLGTTLRSRPAQEKAAIVAAVGRHIWPMVADGRVRPVVQERLPLREAARAHELLESGTVFGKLLLVP